jgi:hypothetical protein
MMEGAATIQKIKTIRQSNAVSLIYKHRLILKHERAATSPEKITEHV